MKFEDWPERLNDFLSIDHKFDWATCNCALFAADAVKVQTGIDFAKDYRGPKTRRGMLARLVRVGGGDVESAILKIADPIENIALTKRGDVVLINHEGINILGVCNGIVSLFVSENEGMIRIPTLKCLKSWAI